jgi:hypothetical protein
MTTQALTKVLLFPLHLSVILSLHTCFAGCRAFSLLSHLFPISSPLLTLSRRRRSPTPATDRVAKRWQKVPQHLAVRIAPSGGGWRIWRTREDEVEEKVKQVEQLAGWCKELGILTLTVYDETGAFHSRSPSFLDHFKADLSIPQVSSFATLNRLLSD